MDSETPDIDAMLDKAFGGPAAPPPAAETDKVEQEPAVVEAPADKAEEVAPAQDEPEDYSRKVNPEDSWTRAIFNREMHKVGQERRALEAKAQELAELKELKDRMDADQAFRDRLIAAYEAANGQVEEGEPARVPAPETRALKARIDRLESYIANQHRDTHATMVEATAMRIAAEHKLTNKDVEAIITNAVNADLIGFGTKPEQVESRLRMVTASYLLPRAKADGQRELIGQIKEKEKVATPARDRAPAPAADPDLSAIKGEQQFVRALVEMAEKAEGGRR